MQFVCELVSNKELYKRANIELMLLKTGEMQKNVTTYWFIDFIDLNQC